VTPVERPPVYTVGHSTRSIAEFVELLKQGDVDLVVDIRSTPRSRTNPQYNLDTVPKAARGKRAPCEEQRRQMEEERSQLEKLRAMITDKIGERSKR
jgi:hypothetical protein